MKKDPCAGCYYRRGPTQDSKSCDYLLIEGHRRPCPPGVECKVKITKKKRSTENEHTF